MKEKLIPFSDIKKELLKDTSVKKEYDRLKPEYEIISELIKLRIKGELTQKQLAERIDTKQSAISRLESGNYNPSLSFLIKMAEAFDKKLEISFK